MDPYDIVDDGPFQNRVDAGVRLAARLRHYAKRDDVLVLALPRGGVPVGFEVAQSLDLPFDVLGVRKLGVPGRPELAMGAIASGGVRVLNEDVIGELSIPPELIEEVAVREGQELERREIVYRGGRPRLNVRDKIAILVDDGLATGATMRAAVAALRERGPARVVVAVPVGAKDTCRELATEADEVICLMTPEPFFAVGVWYRNFGQTTDAEVCELLARAE